MSKLELLKQYIAKLASGGLCIAFSGGVDSTLLLAVAHDVVGADNSVHAVTAYTPFHSPKEPKEAQCLAENIGATFHMLCPTLPDTLWQNPTNRCYLCKKALFTSIGDFAQSSGLSAVLDGTNADDLGEYRPGLKALGELGIHSPLAELGITKSEVREMAKSLGLTVAEKPSAPCLATRFPYDTPLTPDNLTMADQLEQHIRALGIAVVRTRIHGNLLRLEIKPEDFTQLILQREAVIKLVHDCGTPYVTLDLEGFRSGSMDVGLIQR